MTATVVDTNVLVTANGSQSAADDLCQLACVQALLKLQAQGIVTIDESSRILSEYRTYCSYSGQPGVGDLFFRWLHQNQAVPERVERVVIHDSEPETFAEIPIDPALAELDRSDHKFVAVAIASRLSPPIIFSIERGWWRHEGALLTHGVATRSLCPQHQPGRR